MDSDRPRIEIDPPSPGQAAVTVRADPAGTSFRTLNVALAALDDDPAGVMREALRLLREER